MKTNSLTKILSAAAFVAMLSTSSSVFAQVKVGNNPNVINPSAALEIESTNKGFLPSRVALTGLKDVTTIPSPANGLIAYNTATAGTGTEAISPGLYMFDSASASWGKLLSSSTAITDNDGSKLYKTKFRGRNEDVAGFPKPTMRIPEMNLEWRWAVVGGSNYFQVRLLKQPNNDVQLYTIGHWAGVNTNTWNPNYHGSYAGKYTFNAANYSVWQSVDGNWSGQWNYYYLLASNEIRTDGLSPINYISNLYGLCSFGNGWGPTNEPYSLAAEVY